MVGRLIGEHIELSLEAGPGPVPVSAHQETILLVEDESAVRVLIGRVLQGLGYRVITASRPTEAVAVAAVTERIDLLISDVVMPGQSCLELASQLVASRPGLRLLFISGYPRGRLRPRS